MPRKSKITAHAPRIRRLLREGKTAHTIWKELQSLELSLSYEGLRKWIHANPIEGITLNGPGRPRSIEINPFNFLPAELPDLPSTKAPAFILALIALYSEPEDIRMEVTKRAFWQLGLPFDEELPRTEWFLPAQRLIQCSDLEFCLVAYLVSNLPTPPLGGITLHFEEWFEKLMAGAARLKEAAKHGRDTTGKNIFDDPDQTTHGD